MQRAAVGLGLIVAGSAGIVALVHYQQKEEARKLHDGVIKDAARLKWRREQIAKERQNSSRMAAQAEGIDRSAAA
eukprot:SAG31_NODE_808_length_11926_cov_13.255179_3_plen_75_part_00